MAAEATAPEQDCITTDPSFVRKPRASCLRVWGSWRCYRGYGCLTIFAAYEENSGLPMARCFLQTHLAIVLGSLLAATLSLAADFSGLVVSVLDGDTLEVLHNQYPERIRLSGIDCPEKGPAYDTRRLYAE